MDNDTPKTPWYREAVGFFRHEFEAFFSSCMKYTKETRTTSIIDPVALLKEVTRHMRKKRPYIYISNNDEAVVPVIFYTPVKNNTFVDEMIICEHYVHAANKVYGGIFSCHKREATRRYVDNIDQDFSKIITDVDLLCVFVAMVALRGDLFMDESASKKANKEKLFVIIFESLKMMKDIFAGQWKNWPFTRLTGGNEARDERTFQTLSGIDFCHGRENKWRSLPSAILEYRVEEGMGGKAIDYSPTVYTGKPVYDMFQLLPPEAHELLFGEKLANVLRFCYNYSVSDMPYVLASDTHPVIADDSPPIIPSGCYQNSSSYLLSTNNMTLVSRHAIPSARKLGVYLLNRKSPLSLSLGLGRAVAECMVHSSKNDEKATITSPESEIKCLDRHISKLFTRNNTNTEERCGLCDEKLNFRPVFLKNDEVGYDYFPLHAFMDTFEAVDKTCSASLCPECVIRIVLLTYEKVSFGCVAISDAFRCPCCGEYMINWLGRGSEVSKLCKRLLFNSDYSKEMHILSIELVKRIETCFSYLEVLQDQFTFENSSTTSNFLPSNDFLPSKESMFLISDRKIRPPIPRYKLKEGSISNWHSLNCFQCLSPLCCDRPDEYLDFETVDVVPPLTPYDPCHVDVEDTEINNVLNIETLRYDDGPGTHRWPAKLSFSFVSSNAPQGDKEIETCAEAIALLGRIPRKKRRGWNIESPEGKAVVALANWYTKNKPPEDMQQLLSAVSSVFKFNDCTCVKCPSSPNFRYHSRTKKVSEHPLVAAYFRNENQDRQQLMEYAGVFIRSLISECLLQMPECIYHRASSFVLTYANRKIIDGWTPIDAAKLDYVKSLNVARRNMAMGNPEDFYVSYTASQERTVEWAVEKGGDQPKTVSCFNCMLPAIKGGGSVTMICRLCYEMYCWLCEKPIQRNLNQYHMIIDHGLLYSTSTFTKKVFENLYNVEIATLKFHKFMDNNAYIMEDGFTFDINTNRAVRLCQKAAASKEK